MRDVRWGFGVLSHRHLAIVAFAGPWTTELFFVGRLWEFWSSKQVEQYLCLAAPWTTDPSFLGVLELEKALVWSLGGV